MLYNESTGKPKITAPALRDLIAWLETKDQDAGYDFCNFNGCLLAQWVKSIDPLAKATGGGGAYMYFVNDRIIDLSGFREIAFDGGPETFGAALDRARAAVPNGE